MIFEQHSSHLGKLSPAKQRLAKQLDWALYLSLEKQEMMYHQGRQAAEHWKFLKDPIFWEKAWKLQKNIYISEILRQNHVRKQNK